MSRRDLLCPWGHRVCRALGPQVVCGGGVCVRAGVCLYFVVAYLLSAWRDFRVSMNESKWVEAVPEAFSRSRV